MPYKDIAAQRAAEARYYQQLRNDPVRLKTKQAKSKAWLATVLRDPERYRTYMEKAALRDKRKAEARLVDPARYVAYLARRRMAYRRRRAKHSANPEALATWQAYVRNATREWRATVMENKLLHIAQRLEHIKP